MNKNRIFGILVLFSAVILVFGCGNGKYAESGGLIIDAETAIELVDSHGWVLLDAQKNTSYKKEHVDGAVNIQRSQVNVKRKVPNMLAPASKLAEVAGAAGIKNDTNLVIYDDNKNMDSARLAWTFMIYGHAGQIRIVSGGLQALKSAGEEIVKGSTSSAPVKYVTGDFDSSMIIDKEGVLKFIDNPPENYAIIDSRSDEEYNAGTIPGSIHIDYLKNNFSDNTYKPVQQIRILYKDNGIMPEDEIIIFCKSSIRAAETWAALYNAGYRNIKIYDGAWLEWGSDESLPVYVPEVPGKVQIKVEDAS